MEAELAAAYGMSKTPVREALLALSREGLVEIAPSRGMRVRHFSGDDIRDIYELRAVLEPLALLKAAPRLTDAHRERLRGILVAADAAALVGDRRELSHLNREFHDQLVSKCRNRRVVEILGQLHDQLRLIALLFWSVRPTYEHESKQHWSVLQALDEGEAELAAERLRFHITEFCERYVSQLDR